MWVIIFIACQAPFVGESLSLTSRINTNFEIGRSNIWSWLLLSSIPRSSITLLTIPWSSGFVLIVSHNGHGFLGGYFISNTTSLVLTVVHFYLSWRVSTNSLRHLHQNSFVICYTLLHLCLQYKAGLRKTPGGGITTFNLVVNKLFWW